MVALNREIEQFNSIHVDLSSLDRIRNNIILDQEEEKVEFRAMGRNSVEFGHTMRVQTLHQSIFEDEELQEEQVEEVIE